MDKDQRIYVICGGLSQEREVSLRSGNNVFEALLRLGYNNAKLFDWTDPASLIKLIQIRDEIDAVILVTHGEYGEDGRIQGFLDILGIPYTGSGHQASAICMDKVQCKKILEKANLPVLYSCNAVELYSSKASIDGPLIMKLSSGGSSIGIEKFDSSEELVEAINANPELKNNLDQYFVEPFISGKEVTTSIIRINKSHSFEPTNCLATDLNQDWQLVSLPILELRSANEFYDYEAKYTKGMTEFVLPAELSEDLERKIHSAALKAFQTIPCSDLARVDFIIDENEPYILEINTLPGMTDTSDLPAQARAAAIEYDNLVSLMLEFLAEKLEIGTIK